MQKGISKVIVCMLLIATSLFNSAFAYNSEKEDTKAIFVDARSAIAIDKHTNTVLYEKNAHEIMPMASTTKILTALIAINYGDLDKEVEISENAAAIHGSQIGFSAGERITIRELLYGLMLKSGNDAAIAIAEGISGSVEEFCDIMNEYAFELGMTNSHFESPHGLDSENHYSTAYDMAILTAQAKQNDLFNEIVAARVVDGEGNFTRTYHNINKLLYLQQGATGVKTGFTCKAGKCLVSSVEKDGGEIIIVTLNCTPRWNETKKIFSYVDNNYTLETVVDSGEILGEVDVDNSLENVIIVAKDELIIPKYNDEEVKYTWEFVAPNFKVNAPLEENQVLGKIKVFKDGEEVYTKEGIVKKNVKKNSYIELKLEEIQNKL